MSKNKETVSSKQQANELRKPYVEVISVNFDEKNPGQGYFELDWNKHFIEQLYEAGYSGSTDEEVVDQWFTELCRNIAEEV